MSSTRPKIHLLPQSVSIPCLEHFLTNKFVERLPRYFEPRIWSRSQTIWSSGVRPTTMIGSQSLINFFTATVNQGNLYQSSSTRSKAYHISEVLSAPLRLGIYLLKRVTLKNWVTNLRLKQIATGQNNSILAMGILIIKCKSKWSS